MFITSKENPNIKLYKKLSSSKKARNDNGLYVLEGARLVCDAIKENKVEKLFYVNSSLEKYSELISNELLLTVNENNIFEISDELAVQLASTDATQGIFAIAKKGDNSLSISSIRNYKKFLILDNLQDPGNIGTILRTADACGVDCVIMTKNSCDLYNPKTIRSAMGSIFRLNIFDETEFETIVECLRTIDVKVYASVIDSNAAELRNVCFNEKSAVVIGNEGNGMCDEHISMCDEKLTIRMCGNINSLNAAMAAGIILWEMTK